MSAQSTNWAHQSSNVLTKMLTRTSNNFCSQQLELGLRLESTGNGRSRRIAILEKGDPLFQSIRPLVPCHSFHFSCKEFLNLFKKLHLPIPLILVASIHWNCMRRVKAIRCRLVLHTHKKKNSKTRLKHVDLSSLNLILALSNGVSFFFKSPLNPEA